MYYKHIWFIVYISKLNYIQKCTINFHYYMTLEKDPLQIRCPIPGLFLCENFLSNEEEQYYLDKLYNDNNPYLWDTTMKRRVIHYGYLYSYKFVNNSQRQAYPLPDWITELFDKRLRITNDEPLNNIENFMAYKNNKLMAIVNEYTHRQGIAPHIDDPEKFGGWIMCVILSEGCYVNFHLDDITTPIYIPNKSIYIMTGDARYKYRHSITNQSYSKRVSITFRSVNIYIDISDIYIINLIHTSTNNQYSNNTVFYRIDDPFAVPPSQNGERYGGYDIKVQIFVKNYNKYKQIGIIKNNVFYNL
jgi:alkylated DNA repair dioxygenase AlkB